MTSNAVVLLAHQDDEWFALKLMQALSTNFKLHVYYLTDGSAKGLEHAVRDAESSLALRSAQLPALEYEFLGSENRIPDGQLPENIERAWCLLHPRCSELKPSLVVSPDWEGGHVDHDATFLLAAALRSSLLSVEEHWTFPLYNGESTFWKLFRVGQLVAASRANAVELKLSLKQSLFFLGLIRFYKSQLKTWIGLLPGSLRILLFRRSFVYSTKATRFKYARPHEATLLYEKLFGKSYPLFSDLVSKFVTEHIEFNR